MHTNYEYADMHFVIGYAIGVAASIVRGCVKQFLNQQACDWCVVTYA